MAQILGDGGIHQSIFMFFGELKSMKKIHCKATRESYKHLLFL